jgi:hypothetical protein
MCALGIATLGPEVIDGHTAYERAVLQADVHMRNFTEEASLPIGNDAILPCGYSFLENKVCLTYGFVNTIVPFCLRTLTFWSLPTIRRSPGPCTAI